VSRLSIPHFDPGQTGSPFPLFFFFPLFFLFFLFSPFLAHDWSQFKPTATPEDPATSVDFFQSEALPSTTTMGCTNMATVAATKKAATENVATLAALALKKLRPNPPPWLKEMTPAARKSAVSYRIKELRNLDVRLALLDVRPAASESGSGDDHQKWITQLRDQNTKLSAQLATVRQQLQAERAKGAGVPVVAAPVVAAPRPSARERVLEEELQRFRSELCRMTDLRNLVQQQNDTLREQLDLPRQDASKVREELAKSRSDSGTTRTEASVIPEHLAGAPVSTAQPPSARDHELEEELQRVRSELSKMTDIRNLVQQQKDALSEQLEISRLDAGKLREELAASRNDLAAAKMESLGIEEHLVKIREECEAVRRERDAAAQQEGFARAQIAKSQEEVQAARQERDRATLQETVTRTKVDGLQLDLIEAQRQLTELQGKYTYARLQMEAAAEQDKLVRAQLAVSQEQCRELASASQDARHVGEELAKLREECTTARQERLSFERDAKRLRVCVRVGKQLAKDQEDLVSGLKSQIAEMARKQEPLDGVRRERDAWRFECVRLRADVAKMEKECDALTERLRDQSKSGIKEERSDELDVKCARLTEENAKLQAEVDRLRSEAVLLETEMDALTGTLLEVQTRDKQEGTDRAPKRQRTD
jgi:chromosome segregation ATPase